MSSLRLDPFPADSADVVAGWAQTSDDVLMWCGLPTAPVAAEQINAWADEDWVQPFGLYRDDRLVAYGELWVHRDNITAQRSYAAAGFEPVEPSQAAAWNAGQPVNYVWLSLAT